MTSDIEICNMALGNIGAQSINSFSDSSESARICSTQYDFLRDLLLSSHPWGFNRKKAALSEAADVEVPEFAHVYGFPSDALYVHRVFSPDLPEWERAEFEVVSVNGVKVIACDAEGAVFADYRARVTDVSQFPILFCEALVWFLASRLASALARDDAVVSYALRMYQQTVTTACQVLANEDYCVGRFSSSWCDARMGLE